jgi:hypothetical protein
MSICGRSLRKRADQESNASDKISSLLEVMSIVRSPFSMSLQAQKSGAPPVHDDAPL